MPPWLGAGLCVMLGTLALWICISFGPGTPLTLVECANQLMTALLLVYVFRRFSPGVLLSVLGFYLLVAFDVRIASGAQPLSRS